MADIDCLYPMKVREYTCPDCGYTKAPTTHDGCGGNIVRRGGTWRCDACDLAQPIEETVCTRCGAIVPEGAIEVVDMELRE
ncbi:MAG: hypothetical protein ABEJ92_11210 [Halobacteriales archaeon]